MESEIQFLLKILLEHKISPEVKKMFLARIGEVEQSLRAKPQGTIQAAGAYPHPMNMIAQSPSTVAAMMKHAEPIAMALPEPLVNTQAAANALVKRQQAIFSAGIEKPEPGRTSPRKF